MTLSLKDAALGDLDTELKNTRRLLERLPDKHLGWKPHARSWSLGELATHVVNLLFWQTGLLREDGFDLAAMPPPSAAVESREEALRRFDEQAEALREAYHHTEDAALQETWTLRRGEHVLARQPRVWAFRTVGLSHLIHHRGQLSVYLRLIDVPVPGLYGPSSDDMAGR